MLNIDKKDVTGWYYVSTKIELVKERYSIDQFLYKEENGDSLYKRAEVLKKKYW